MRTVTEQRMRDVDSWIHESAIWSSDVDFWLDEIHSYQELLDKALGCIHEKDRLNSLDHLQNIVTYYGNEVLFDLKEKIKSHKEDLSSCNNGSLAAMYEKVVTDHNMIQVEVIDLEQKLKAYKVEFLELKASMGSPESVADLPLQHVLIPTDFSENADRAVDYTLSILGKVIRKITLLHVYHSATPADLGLNSEDEIAARISHEQFENEISRIGRGFPDLADKVVTTFSVGNLNQEVNEIVKEQNIDLLVMGTRGAGNSSILFGHHTAKIVQTIDIPVLVIPTEAPLLPPKRMMFATDLELVERPHGIDILKCISEQYRAELHIVHVDSMGQAMDSAHERFNVNEVMEELDLEGKKVEYIESNDVLNGINEYVKEHLIDVAVTITHHEGFLKSLFAPSTTRQLVLHSHIPILVLHDPDQHEQ